jgi:hypothetical protein
MIGLGLGYTIGVNPGITADDHSSSRSSMYP